MRQLMTFRASCVRIFRSRWYPPDFIWFEGVAAICQEAIDRIKEALGIIEKTRK